MYVCVCGYVYVCVWGGGGISETGMLLISFHFHKVMNIVKMSTFFCVMSYVLLIELMCMVKSLPVKGRNVELYDQK